MSIMAMRVKILPAGSTFKINISTTTPFNAVRIHVERSVFCVID